MKAYRLICVSGWAAGPSRWYSVLEQLAGDPEVIHVPWWQCLGHTADDNALMRTLCDDGAPAIVAGWSLGGIVSLRAAIAKPDAIEAMVLVSTTARMTADGDYPGVAPRMLRAMLMRLGRDRAGVLTDFARLCVAAGSEASPDAAAFVADYVAGAQSIPLDDLSAGLVYLQQTDLRADLAGLSVPVSVVHGARDRVIPLAGARCMAASLSNARFQCVAGVGHALLDHAPHVVARTIEESIADVHVA